MKPDPIVVSGIGMVTPLGANTARSWQALCAKKTAAQHWEDLAQEQFSRTTACRVPGIEVPPSQRGLHLAKTASEEALQQAGQPTGRGGVFLGSTLGESAAYELAAAHGHTSVPVRYSCYGLAKQLAQTYRATASIKAYGTACAAGNYALAGATTALEQDQLDWALAGGVDPFSRIAMAGFARSRAMSTQGLCRPFSPRRDGMLLGEGAAFLVLEKASRVLARGQKPLAIVGAAGFTTDAYHPTAPDPGGQQMRRAMRMAIDQQGIRAEEVDWVCAHGSGTRISDQTEANAIAEVFGEQTTVSAFKGAFGHSLGAATAIEAAVVIQSLQSELIPPTVNTTAVDPDLNIDLVTQPRPARARWVLNCGFAFGGLNATLLLGKWT